MIKIIDGIAYEDDKPIILHIIDIKSQPDYHLLTTFQDGSVRLYDFRPLLEKDVFRPLNEQQKFNRVSLDHGVPTWRDEDLDLSPEAIYANSIESC